MTDRFAVQGEPEWVYKLPNHKKDWIRSQLRALEYRVPGEHVIKYALAAAAVIVAVTAAAKLHGRSLHERDRQLRLKAEIEERIQRDWRR